MGRLISAASLLLSSCGHPAFAADGTYHHYLLTAAVVSTDGSVRVSNTIHHSLKECFAAKREMFMALRLSAANPRAIAPGLKWAGHMPAGMVASCIDITPAFEGVEGNDA